MGWFKTLLLAKLRFRKAIKSDNAASHGIKRCTFTVLFMGDAKVGKTSIIRSICGKKHELQYKPTVLEISEKEVLLEEFDIKIDFVDLSGYYEFPAMKKVYIEKADQFVLVYARDNDESFLQVQRLKQEICAVRGKHSTELPILVVKNKVDASKPQKILFDERRQSILSWCYSLIDCSAKTGYNINQILEHVLVECKNKNTCPELRTNIVSGRYVYGGLKKSASFNNRRRLLRLASERGRSMTASSRLSYLPPSK